MLRILAHGVVVGAGCHPYWVTSIRHVAYPCAWGGLVVGAKGMVWVVGWCWGPWHGVVGW